MILLLWFLCFTKNCYEYPVYTCYGIPDFVSIFTELFPILCMPFMMTIDFMFSFIVLLFVELIMYHFLLFFLMEVPMSYMWHQSHICLMQSEFEFLSTLTNVNSWGLHSWQSTPLVTPSTKPIRGGIYIKSKIKIDKGIPLPILILGEKQKAAGSLC